MKLFGKRAAKNLNSNERSHCGLSAVKVGDAEQFRGSKYEDNGSTFGDLRKL